jgi:hypothetical protein
MAWQHPDFAGRFLSEGSKDWNDKDDDPSPRLSDDTHGTCTSFHHSPPRPHSHVREASSSTNTHMVACAGLVGAGMNDGVCGVGLSYRCDNAASVIVLFSDHT